MGEEDEETLVVHVISERFCIAHGFDASMAALPLSAMLPALLKKQPAPISKLCGRTCKESARSSEARCCWRYF